MRNLKILFTVLTLCAIGALSVCCQSKVCYKKCEKKTYKLAVMDSTLGPAYKRKPISLDKAKELGFDGVQISGHERKGEDFLSQSEIDAYNKKQAETGLKIPSLTVGTVRFFDNPDCVRAIKSAIDAASKVGAKNILVAFFGPNKITGADKKLIEKYVPEVVANLKSIMSYAEEKGVFICMENTLSADDNIRLIKEVGSKNLKVYFDVFNIVYYGHEEISSIEKLSDDYIGEIHLKDEGHKFGSSNTKPKSFIACIEAIKKIKYNNQWLTFEVHAFKHKERNVDEVLKFNINYVKENF